MAVHGEYIDENITTDLGVDPGDTFIAKGAAQESRLRRWLAYIGVAGLALTVVGGSYYDVRQANRDKSVAAADARLLPAKLPSAVQRYENSVGQIYEWVLDSTNEGVPLSTSTVYQASGVELNKHLFLTAGHVLVPNPQALNIKPEGQCRIIEFDTPSFGAYISGAYGKFKNQQYGTDIGLMTPRQLDWSGNDSEDVPQVKLAKTPLVDGQQVFFVNYQPRSNGVVRSPDNNSGPAVYGGIYQGETPDKDYEIITGLRSYGHKFADSVRGGASGGAVFNAKGQLEGVVADSSEATTYLNLFGLKLSFLGDSESASFAIVQPVNQAMIDDLKAKLSPVTQECKQTNYMH